MNVQSRINQKSRCMKRRTAKLLNFLLLLSLLLMSPVASAEVSTAQISNQEAPVANYVIFPGDILEITVWGYDELTAVAKVRPDGGISYPLIGSVAAAGLSPQQLADVISGKLSDYVRNPRTMVTVKDYHMIIVEVLGAVRQPGAYTVHYGARITEVLALAGGTSAEADSSHARFTRKTGGAAQEGQIQTLDLQKLLARGETGHDLLLAEGDRLYIPYRKMIDWGKLLTIVSVAEILRRLLTGW